MRIIIAGAFAIGSYLAKLLSRNKQEVVLMDQDEEKLGKLAIDYDLLTMHASATSIRSLKRQGWRILTSSSPSRPMRAII